jgi:hypothetical protein
MGGTIAPPDKCLSPPPGSGTLTVSRPIGGGVNRDRLLMALAAVFAGLSVFVAMVAIVFQPVLLVVAVPFGVVTYFMWYQASGRLGRRIYRGVENRARTDDRRQERGGFGAGPREAYEPRGEWFREPGDPRGARGGRRTRQRTAPRTTDGPTAREAREILEVGADADEEAVRRAYREKVKQVHPDTPDGDEERFKRVTAAYERLAED